MYKVSIIIPIYNGEKHIKNCYNAINNQTEKSLEIIFINDGSTDNSLGILKEIKIHDNRVFIIDQINQGVSVARNNGIISAKSEYIGFVDVDDIILPDYFSNLCNRIKDNDIVVSNILLEKNKEIIIKESFFSYNVIFDNKYCNREIISRLLCIEDLVLLSSCNKIYRKKFLLQEKIFFDKQISLEEDGVFNCLAFSKCEKVIFINYAGYVYKDNQESATRNIISNKIFEKLLDKYNNDYYKIIDLQFSDDDLKKFRSSRLIFSISLLVFRIINSKNITINKKKYCIKAILTNKNVFLASKNLHPMYKYSMSKFEKLIVYLIKSNSELKINILINSLNYILHPKLVTLLRKINKL